MFSLILKFFVKKLYNGYKNYLKKQLIITKSSSETLQKEGQGVYQGRGVYQGLYGICLIFIFRKFPPNYEGGDIRWTNEEPYREHGEDWLNMMDSWLGKCIVAIDNSSSFTLKSFKILSEGIVRMNASFHGIIQLVK